MSCWNPARLDETFRWIARTEETKYRDELRLYTRRYTACKYGQTTIDRGWKRGTRTLTFKHTGLPLKAIRTAPPPATLLETCSCSSWGLRDRPLHPNAPPRHQIPVPNGRNSAYLTVLLEELVFPLIALRATFVIYCSRPDSIPPKMARNIVGFPVEDEPARYLSAGWVPLAVQGL